MQPPTFYRIQAIDRISDTGIVVVQLDPGEAQGLGRDSVRVSWQAIRSLGLKPGGVVAMRLEVISSEEKPA